MVIVYYWSLVSDFAAGLYSVEKDFIVGLPADVLYLFDLFR